MANIPGISGYYQPSVFTRVRTLTKAVSIPGGLRVISVQGEGLKEETVIDAAKGDGTDGFNPDFVTTSDGYGRFYRLANYPVVENRTVLYLNGSQLRIVEDVIDNTTFSSDFDARFDYNTGEIEMQKAFLIDQGGAYYSAATTNVGDGYIANLILEDDNAPAETWTVRCINTLLDTNGAPIRKQATFITSGSVSGQIKDAYGQPYLWKSNDVVVNNGILSFSISDLAPKVIFERGDRFTISVASGVLQKNDQLTAKYIAETDLNDAETFDDPQQLFAKHGSPSTTNTLSLGAQMAFENGATAVLTVQAKPPLPRRTSEIVLAPYDSRSGDEGATGNDTQEDLIFAISSPGKPDADTQVHFFIEDEDGTEIQIFPNKVDFYDPDLTDYFSDYEDDRTDTQLWDNFSNPSSSGYAYSYTVISDLKVEQSSDDGYLHLVTGGGLSASFTSNNINLTTASVGKLLDFHNTLAGNLGRFTITSVTSQHTAKISRSSGTFVDESSIRWQLLPANTVGAETSQQVLITKDLALAQYSGLRVTYIDQKDVDFFDPNWAEVLDVLETQDAQILVPLPTQTISAIQQAFKVHVINMSTTYYKKERLLFTGALQGLTVANVLGQDTAAVEDIGTLEGIQGDSPEDILDSNIEDLADYGVVTNFGDTFRVLYFYPDEIIRVTNGERTLLPGYFMAAAAGGWFAGQANIAMPITMKTLVGFTLSNSKVYKQETLNNLGNAGIIVCQPIAGGVRVLHGKTTTQSGYPEEEEAQIVFIRDQFAKTLRAVLQVFVGAPEDSTLMASITAKVIGAVNSFMASNYITASRNLSVKRDTVEPRQWNISIEVQPNYATMWLFADVTVGLF